MKTWKINYNASIYHGLLFMFYVLTHTHSYINIFFYDTFILSSFGQHTIYPPLSFSIWNKRVMKRLRSIYMSVRYKENSLSVTVYALYLGFFREFFVLYLNDCYIYVFSMNALYTNSLTNIQYYIPSILTKLLPSHHNIYYKPHFMTLNFKCDLEKRVSYGFSVLWKSEKR